MTQGYAGSPHRQVKPGCARNERSRQLVRQHAARVIFIAILFLAAPATALGASYVTQFTYDASGHMRTAHTYDTDSDAANCGAIGTACEGAATDCSGGRCGAWTPGGEFVDPMTDVSNCGGVSRTCSDVPENGYATCMRGTCGFECYAGYDVAGASCVDPMTDPFNCGGVGNVCDEAYAGTATCTYGTCGSDTFRQPVVETLNGVAAGGELYRSPPWKGLVVTGHGFEHVTYVEVEWGGQDADPDTYDANGNPVPGGPSIPFFVSRYGSPWDRFWVVESADTIRIDVDKLWHWILVERKWFRLRLHYDDWYAGDISVVVDVPFSLDYPGPVDLPAPLITGVSLIRHVWGNGFSYDPRTGEI